MNCQPQDTELAECKYSRTVYYSFHLLMAHFLKFSSFHLFYHAPLLSTVSSNSQIFLVVYVPTNSQYLSWQVPPTFSVYNNATRYICHLCIHPLIYLLTIWARPSLHKPLWNDSLSTISNEHSTSLPTLNVPRWTWHFDLSNLSLFPQISVFHKHHHLLSQTLPLKDLGSPSSSLK